MILFSVVVIISQEANDMKNYRKILVIVDELKSLIRLQLRWNSATKKRKLTAMTMTEHIFFLI